MKKSILASIISLLLISAVGCDNSNENSNTGTPSQIKQSKQHNLSLIQKTLNLMKFNLARKLKKVTCG